MIRKILYFFANFSKLQQHWILDSSPFILIFTISAAKKDVDRLGDRNQWKSMSVIREQIQFRLAKRITLPLGSKDNISKTIMNTNLKSRHFTVCANANDQ